MKSKILLLIVLSFSISVSAQKKVLKAAEKSLKKENYSVALEQVKSIEGTINDAEDKYKHKYYYVKAKAIFGDGSDVSKDKESAAALNELVDFEKEIGSGKYSKDALETINVIIKRTVADGSNLFKAKDYKTASKKFEFVYTLSPRDTSTLDNAALASYYGEDHDRSIELYKQLLAMGYTGITKQFKAISAVSGKPIYFAAKEEMDKQVELGIASDPEVLVSESRTGDIAKNIALSYIAKGDQQAALAAISDAKKIFPDDYTLVISEANIYFKLGDNEKFLAGLKEAIKLRPDSEQLYYNIGVLTMEQGYNDEAIAYFKKAIELKPDYGDAYNNIGVAVLDKTKPIIEEMNKNLSNFKKYDQLLLKQKGIYKEALPYFEKSLDYSSESVPTLRTLVGLYELLEMFDLQKETQVKLDALK